MKFVVFEIKNCNTNEILNSLKLKSFFNTFYFSLLFIQINYLVLSIFNFIAYQLLKNINLVFSMVIYIFFRLNKAKYDSFDRFISHPKHWHS